MMDSWRYLKLSSLGERTFVLMIAIVLLLAIVNSTSGKCADYPSKTPRDNFQATILNLKNEMRRISQKCEENSQQFTEQLAETNSLIASLKTDASHRITEVANRISGMPTSCADLRQIGHYLSGFYSVKSDQLVESVYCDFTKETNEPRFQTRVGYVDVKSSHVHFHVQRNSKFSIRNVPIPFELEKLNIGGAMNLASGTFTAPRPGTYFFFFNGISGSHPGSSVHVALFLNGNTICEGNSETNYATITIHTSLSLKAGDKIWLAVVRAGSGEFLFDDNRHWTHFSGWLHQEDNIFLTK